ncbi:hypothetical protein [Prauserella muralis]|uniref:Uncharacterized protein n=1 Tax=Prauserella muralis TaxID=588067 RepID=A0A2V4ACC6_9PSEU|nr:hypothetical protein [Prauserella muralis]PXY16545.1 hypothetical protein BAY60_35685 [Prauserella muralis]TWE11215.1 hypothetical protein FHX69_7436 [Prauserella muralis]
MHALRVSLLAGALALASPSTSCEMPATTAPQPPVNDVGSARYTDTGTCEPNPKQQCPGLYDALHDAAFGDYPYEGGNAWTCGEWGTVDREQAIKFAKRCPPVTRGKLSTSGN